MSDLGPYVYAGVRPSGAAEAGRTIDAKSGDRHDDAGVGVSIGPQRRDHFRGGRTLLDVGLDPDDDAYADGWRRWFPRRSETRGWWRNALYDGIPRRGSAGGNRICHQGTRSYSSCRSYEWTGSFSFIDTASFVRQQAFSLGLGFSSRSVPASSEATDSSSNGSAA